MGEDVLETEKFCFAFIACTDLLKIIQFLRIFGESLLIFYRFLRETLVA